MEGKWFLRYTFPDHRSPGITSMPTKINISLNSITEEGAIEEAKFILGKKIDSGFFKIGNPYNIRIVYEREIKIF